MFEFNFLSLSLTKNRRFAQMLWYFKGNNQSKKVFEFWTYAITLFFQRFNILKEEMCLRHAMSWLKLEPISPIPHPNIRNVPNPHIQIYPIPISTLNIYPWSPALTLQSISLLLRYQLGVGVWRYFSKVLFLWNRARWQTNKIQCTLHSLMTRECM